MCEQGTLAPDKGLSCRYRIQGTRFDVDVISPDGMNVGPPSPWLRRAAERAHAYDLGDGRSAKAATPPYFLATKLVAFRDRGPDAPSSKDLEDIVALVVEVDDLREQVEREGIGLEMSRLCWDAFERHTLKLDDVPDLVDAHLHRDDREHRARVISTLRAIAGPIPSRR